MKQEEAVDISKNVRIIYSDSAAVKAVLTGPEMRIYHDSIGNRQSEFVFPIGVQIVFYGNDKKETHRIKSDYGKRNEQTGIVEFKKNVVITRIDGSVINTEELFFDENKDIYYNNVPISFNMKDDMGNGHATSFTSDGKFQRIIGQNMTATKKVDERSSFSLF